LNQSHSIAASRQENAHNQKAWQTEKEGGGAISCRIASNTTRKWVAAKAGPACRAQHAVVWLVKMYLGFQP
jgi:hypothetical protein